MFNKNLGAIAPFISDVADEMFPNINGVDYRGDNSFVATLRALLPKRMPEGSNIRVLYSRLERTESEIKEMDTDAIIEHTIGNENSDILYVIDCHMEDAAMDAMIAKLDAEDSGFVAKRGGTDFREIANVVEKYTKCRVYTVPENRYSVIFVHNIDMRKWHFIQAFVFKCLPWLFGEEPLNELEKNLIISCRNKYSTAYEEAIAALGKSYDFRSASIRKILCDFEKNARKVQIEAVMNEISKFNSDIHDLEERIRRYYIQKDDANIRLLGLQNIIENSGDDSELVSYFQHNKSLTPIRTSGTSFEFIVKTYLEYFDFEFYRHSTSRGGILNEIPSIYEGPFTDVKNRKLLLDAIFSDEPQMRIKICAVYCLDMRGSVSTHSNYDFPSDCENYIPNPHLQYHACLGNHNQKIRECLGKGDSIMAVEQCISSAKSLNLSEWSATASKFILDVMKSNKKIIELETGEEVTAVEALNWLKEQQKSKE